LGFLDTVIEGQTVVFFDRPMPSKIAGAVKRLLAQGWPVVQLRSHADRFNENRFIERLGRSYSSSEPTCRAALQFRLQASDTSSGRLTPAMGPTPGDAL